MNQYEMERKQALVQSTVAEIVNAKAIQGNLNWETDTNPAGGYRIILHNADGSINQIHSCGEPPSRPSEGDWEVHSDAKGDMRVHRNGEKFHWVGEVSGKECDPARSAPGLNTIASDHNSSMAALRTEVEKLKSSFNEISLDATKWRESYNLSQHLNKKLESSAYKLEAVVQESEKELAEVKAENHGLKERLDDCNAEIMHLKANVEEWKSKSGIDDAKIKELSEQLGAGQNANANNMADISFHKDTISRLDKALVEAKAGKVKDRWEINSIDSRLIVGRGTSGPRVVAEARTPEDAAKFTLAHNGDKPKSDPAEHKPKGYWEATNCGDNGWSIFEYTDTGSCFNLFTYGFALPTKEWATRHNKAMGLIKEEEC